AIARCEDRVTALTEIAVTRSCRRPSLTRLSCTHRQYLSSERTMIATMMMVDAHTMMMPMPAPHPHVHAWAGIAVVMAMMVVAMAPLHPYRYVGPRVPIPMVVMPMPMLDTISVTKVTGHSDA